MNNLRFYKKDDLDTRWSWSVFYPNEELCCAQWTFDSYTDALEGIIDLGLDEFEIYSCRLVLKKFRKEVEENG